MDPRAKEIFDDVFLKGKEAGDAIIEQEKRGQKILKQEQLLPKNYRNKSTEEYLSILLKIGINVLRDYDDLFYEVELPGGWEIKPSEHQMWSYLKDQLGRERAHIFYKAAFYDRNAHIHFCTKYITKIDVKENEIIGNITDGINEFYVASFSLINLPVDELERIMKKNEYKNRLYKICEEYLETHYPDWQDPVAYWED